MEDSVAEEAEAIKQKKKKGTIQIVKLEYIENEIKDSKRRNPIPG
jgi:hypothetical protein